MYLTLVKTNWSTLFPFLFIEFIRVTLGNKITQVSGIQFYSAWSVCCVVYSQPQVKSPSITIYIPVPSFPSPSPHNHHTVVYVHEFFLPFFFFDQSIHPLSSPHPLTDVSLFCIYESVSILLVTSFWSLDSTYEWNHTVVVFLWLFISLCIMFSRFIYAVFWLEHLNPLHLKWLLIDTCSYLFYSFNCVPLFFSPLSPVLLLLLFLLLLLLKTVILTFHVISISHNTGLMVKKYIYLLAFLHLGSSLFPLQF